MAIDDPNVKIRELVEDSRFDFFGTSLQVGAVFTPIFKIAALAKGITEGLFSGDPIKAALRALCDELQRLESYWPHDFESAMDAVWFRRAVVALMEESARAADENHARLLARVAAHGCFPTGMDEHRKEDLASYIRDLGRLGTDDVQMLKLFGSAYREVKIKTPNLHDPNYFTHHYESFRNEAERLKIHIDDRLSIGARLSGFGLAVLSPIPYTNVAISEQYYRPSNRGYYLLSLLEAAELPVDHQN